MDKWKLLVTRETVLLERYIRVEGYQNMFGAHSKVKVKNLFVVNKDGLTSQYVFTPEAHERLSLVWQEYEKNYFKKFLPFWNEILKRLKKSTESVLLYCTATNFRIFVKWYQLARAIVFYTNDLSKLLELKKLHQETLDVGEWHEKAEVESSTAWDSLSPFFEKLCKEYKISQENLMFYSPNEFFELLEIGQKVQVQTLKNRKKYYVLWLQEGKIKFYTGEKAHRIETQQLPQTKIEKIKEIRGSIAYKGKVIGKVRIVNTKSQMERMKMGEILVSVMTTPRLLLAIKKAAAIITDEGGITCHAAIVSREFKIPCIVGTKNASQILQDGDLVELDANNGVIKIL